MIMKPEAAGLIKRLAWCQGNESAGWGIYDAETAEEIGMAGEDANIGCQRGS